MGVWRYGQIMLMESDGLASFGTQPRPDKGQQPLMSLLLPRYLHPPSLPLQDPASRVALAKASSLVRRQVVPHVRSTLLADKV